MKFITANPTIAALGDDYLAAFQASDGTRLHVHNSGLDLWLTLTPNPDDPHWLRLG